MLRRLYDKNYQTVRAHLRELNELEVIRPDSAEGIRAVLDKVRVTRKQLKSLITVEKLADFQMIHKVELQMNPDLRKEWDRKQGVTKLPVMEDLFAFLEQEN